MRTAPFAAMLLAASPAAAAWQVNTSTDPLTDRTYTSASVSIAGAELRVQCLNGKVTPLIEFDRRVGVYQISMAYRFDAGAVVSHNVFMARDARTAWPWLVDSAGGLAKIRGAKRLRVQIWPVGRAVEFYDFDLTGAAEAVKRAKC